MDAVWNEVESFVRGKAGIPPRRIVTPATRIEDDLNLTGDEAARFMGSFFEHFGVDAGDYDFNRYFVTEGSGLLLFLSTALSRKRRDGLRRLPLTVGMLAEAARRRRWQSRELETEGRS